MNPSEFSNEVIRFRLDLQSDVLGSLAPSKVSDHTRSLSVEDLRATVRTFAKALAEYSSVSEIQAKLPHVREQVEAEARLIALLPRDQIVAAMLRAHALQPPGADAAIGYSLFLDEICDCPSLMRQ